MIFAAECVHCGLLQSYAGLLMDLPHLFFEITLTLVQDVLIGLLLWPVAKRAIKRYRQGIHDELDAEHGFAHKEVDDG